METIVRFGLCCVMTFIAFLYGRITAEREMTERLNEVMDEFRKAHPELFEDE